MENGKERFKDFILHNHVSETKNNSLSGQSPDKYITNLNTLNKKISVMSEDKNFFDYGEDEYPALIDNIRNAPDFDRVNSSTNRTISSALNVFEKFIEYLKISAETYLSIKISNPAYEDAVKAIKEKKTNIEVSQLNQLKEKIAIGQLVFMVPFGDKVPWEKGLAGIAKVTELPYDCEDKNYKIKVSMFCSFKTISRAEFIPYPGTYDAADIGPSTKGSQNQAIKQITAEQTASIIRAILELRPETKKDIVDNIDNRLLNISFGKQMILKGIYSNYNQNLVNNNQVGENIIFYGVPGCGKSWYVEHTLLAGVDEKNKFRTTFYLDYSNSDFIGQIYPSVSRTTDENGNSTSNVDYIRNPGPFTRALARAYSTTEQVYLVIEEINRGNAAAIFGDLFQLLDRLQSDSDKDNRIAGDSEYPINNEFIEGYLKEAKDADGNPISIDIPAGISKIYIPHNLTIYATMNTSDQNVFPLDTAFKRRWQRERVVTDWKDVNDELKNAYVPGTDIKWQDFVKKVNDAIVEPSDNGTISEDKQIGAYFVNKDMLTVTPIAMDTANKDEQDKIRNFVNNVIDYLYNDVTKFDHKKLFDEKFTSYDSLYDNIVNKHDPSFGLKILSNNDN